METKLIKPSVTTANSHPTIRANKNKSSKKKPFVAVVGDSCYLLQYVKGRESMSHQQVVFEAGCRRNLA